MNTTMENNEEMHDKMEVEETRRGQMLVDVLHLHRAERGRYHTQWGSKTPLGIYRTVKRIVEKGE